MPRKSTMIALKNTAKRSSIYHSSDPCDPGYYYRGSTVQQYVMLANIHFHDINPLLCGEQRCPANFSYGPKARDFYILHYVVSGRGILTVKNQTYHIERGQIFIIRPQEVAYYCADSLTPWHYRWIGFSSKLDLAELLHKNVINAPECDSIFEQIIQSNSLEKYKEYYICGKIYELLSLISQNSDIKEDQSYEYVLKAKNFIHINYPNNITIANIAENLNIDRSYFSTLFKKYTGKSPQQYLVDYRLQKAADLIATGKHKPGEVALLCGYTDVFNFSKMFKKKYGIPPTEYAKLNR